MFTIKMVKALSTADALSVSRDSLLRGMVIVPLGLAAAIRWLFPPAMARIDPLLPFDLQIWYPRVMSYVLLLLAPTICGTVVGFILLDQRDDDTLTALRVTPLPLVGYLAYRLVVPMLLSLVMTLIALPLSGLVSFGPVALLMVMLAAAPIAPLTALFLGVFAANKVQGFAIQKALGVFMVAPLLGLVLPMPWQLLAWLVPTYWPAALLWALTDGANHPWALLAGGILYQGVLLVGLLRRFSHP